MLCYLADGGLLHFRGKWSSSGIVISMVREPINIGANS